ncbi:hypothetical protein GCM10025770_19150 [Viridibacterium curvum]|uniref:TonB-dependent receptor n=1 Tax=Viridibacterium curvum TaxID=1101404 RepID=A0ABP9QNI2_9RHOO
MRVPLRWLALALSGLPLACFAAPPEDPFIEDLPVVISASRMPQSLDRAPGSVTVIDGDLIRASGYRDLARIFRLVPGMQTGQERGNNYWVSYHGLGNNFPSELQVLVDGRSIYSLASFGGVDWTNLPVTPDEIERIEVVRGPNAATYGANAFMGVINIITRHTAQSPDGRLTGRVGNAQIRDSDGITHFEAGPTRTQLALSTRHDSGFDNLRDERRSELLTLRSDWQVSNRNEVMLRASASNLRRGEGYDSTLYDSNGSRKSWGTAQSLHLKWVGTPREDEELLAQYFHNESHYTDGWTAHIPAGYPYGPTQIDVNRNRRSSRDQFEFQHRSSGKTRQMVWGVEARRDRTSSPYMYANGEPKPVDLYRLFGSLDEDLARHWQLNIGAAIERYRSEPTHFAPRSFLNWQAAEGHTLRVGAARAYQQRPTFEKEGDIRVIDPVSGALLVRAYMPNPDLRQERIDSAEIGYLGRFRTLSTTLDVRLFNERIKDYIARVSVNSPAPYTAALESWIGSLQYQNMSRTITLRGVEYQLKSRPWRNGEIILSHAMIDRHSGDAGIDDRVAPYVASLSWFQKLDAHWSGMISVLRMGPISGGDGIAPLTNYVAKPYTSFDARIAWQTMLRQHRKLEIALNAINLGEKHQEIPDRGVQSYHATLGDKTPANITSRMIYLSASLDM